MENLHLLEMSVLVDILAQHTTNYTRMLSQGAPDQEFDKCKLAIRAIQTEIEFRKQTPGNTTISDPDIIFTEYKASDDTENSKT